MTSLQIPQEKLDWIARENNLVYALTIEIEKVLHWYRDHPHYPLDFEKVREKIAEAHTRLEGIAELLKELQCPGTRTPAEDFSENVWL